MISIDLGRIGAFDIRRANRIRGDSWIAYWRSSAFQTHHLAIGKTVFTWRFGHCKEKK